MEEHVGKRPDQRRLAAHLGISQATVCRALNGARSVRPELREAVLRAAAELGYTPNLLGRNLVRQSSSMIGIVASSLNLPFFARAVHGAEENAERRGYYTIVCSTDGRAEREEKVLQLLASHMADGLIFISASGNRSNDHMVRFHGRYPRIVLVNRYGAGSSIDTVLIDNEGGMRAATEWLIDAGHRRVGLMGSLTGQNGVDRVAGYRAAVAARGLEPGPELILPASVDLAAAQIAAADLLGCAERPTAVVAVNDLMAVGVYRAATAAGLRVPDDVAVIAWDDHGYGRAMTPPLSVVVPPWEEAGRFATDLLLQRLAEPETPTARVLLSCTLELRESSVHAGGPAARRV